MNAKRSNIGWAISDYTAFYRTGGTPAITSMASGSVVVTTTTIKEGQLLFVWKTEDTTGAVSGKFIAVATSSGLTASFRVLSGTEVGSGSGYTLAMIATNSVFNVPISDLQTDTAVVFNATTHKITSTTTTFNIGDLVVIFGCVTGTLLPTVYFIGEIINSSTNEYRVLYGSEVAYATLTSYMLFSLTPKYCVMNLEGIDLEEIVNVMDAENGTYTYIKDGQSFDGLGNNPMYDNTICYNLRDNNQLDIYRGITSDNGVFLIATQIDYLTEKPIVTQQMPSE